MKVFVTRKIPQAGINLLKKKGYEVDISGKDGVLTKKELITLLSKKPYDAVLCLLTDNIDAEIFGAAPQAKIFANYAVGFNNIDVAEARKRGVTVTNTPEVLTDTVAEHTFALMMAIAHRVVEGDRFVRDGKYQGWAPELLLGTDIRGKTLGILGAGRIGLRVAYQGKNGFDMKVIYYDVRRNEEIERECQAGFRKTVEEVLKEADFVSVHVPLLESTHHLINKERLSLMKFSAYLINTSRGPVVDEKALFEALRDGVIRGAALDVFEQEPKTYPGLADLPNVILTPHIASATEETRSKMAVLAAENIIAFFEGKTPPNKI
ncbi:MAG: D-isomer specific 2-hydroxyacid dehydrogenase NAD-binding protein [Parcubacteria group bacterium Gr01-1014_107]|nr:MAG: D-isomer specific 2-hydroxyacid dehydrogenase NAD-binding protein [Parcubacteria group bacterium Gr01-1014_107]